MYTVYDLLNMLTSILLVALNSHIGALAAWLSRFLDHTQTHHWWAHRRDLYLTTRNIHKRQTSMPSAGFEPTTPANERLQTHALNGADIGIGLCLPYVSQIKPLGPLHTHRQNRCRVRLRRRMQCKQMGVFTRSRAPGRRPAYQFH